MDHDISALPFFCCPSCRGKLARQAGFDGLSCVDCQNVVRSSDEIILFAPESVRTQLDDIDYDSFYQVDMASSEASFLATKSIAGSRLASRYDTVLEVGAGTGGFTAGFLNNISVKNAIVTDVSSKMLSICRQRLTENLIDPPESLIFATYSTAEDCLAEDTFDLIVGSFVIHHVLDYEAFFARSHRAMKVGGKCLFLEPGYRFHKALVNTVLDVFGSLAADNVSDQQDIILLTNWISEINFNIKYSGDAGILSSREDKHLFRADAIQVAAIRAGFSTVEAIPYGVPDFGMNAARVYSAQLGLSEGFRLRFLGLFKAYSRQHFELLASVDSTPSFLFVLGKDTVVDSDSRGVTEIAEVAAPAGRIDSTTGFVSYLHHHLELSLTRSEGQVVLSIIGWACSSHQVLYVLLRSSEGEFTAPIGLPRLDVQQAINSSRYLPVENVLFSGVNSSFGLLATSDEDVECSVAVQFFLASGQVIDAGIASLREGDATSLGGVLDFRPWDD
jgi:ubiquinone/menaquinone biosynthesis C-methylase UbiE